MNKLLSLAVLIGLLLPGLSRAAEPVKLNVVVILADDLGWADLGCYGSRYHRTPNLDRLARAGLRFAHGYASCPVCSPTRAALMTGKYPARVGITDWLPGRPDRPDQPLARPKLDQQLSRDETTLATAFKKAGYSTGHIGKWHLGGAGFGPREHGFDLNIGGDQAGSPRSYFAPFRNASGKMPGLDKASEGEYLTDRLTAEAEKFIDDHRDKPFFLYLAHYAVHIPMRAKKELIEKYPGKPAFGRQSNPVYAAMLQSLDESVGRVMKKLDERKLAERTIVVFTSDNGGLATLEGPNTPPTINSPLREGKGFLYEGGLRVPWIVKWPGFKPGVVSTPLITHDLFPTLAEACGLKTEAKVDGVSLVGLLKEGKPPKRDALFWHYPHYSNQGGKPGGAVREGSWKLIEFYEDNRCELFNLEKDPGEHRNRAADEPERVKSLAAKLDAWRKSVGARMPKPNPGYLPHPQDKDGSITLHASKARIHGTQLRYEPLPHKNTLGYWTEKADQASWEFTVTKPGRFKVVVMQGCGAGQGGSVVEWVVGEQKSAFTVKDTGGFQAFEMVPAGHLAIDKPGRYSLILRPKSKAKAAVMDVRLVRLNRE